MRYELKISKLIYLLIYSCSFHAITSENFQLNDIPCFRIFNLVFGSNKKIIGDRLLVTLLLKKTCYIFKPLV